VHVQFLFPLQIIFFISLVYVVFMEHMQDKANPLATILSAAMLLKYGLGEVKAAQRIENFVLAHILQRK